MDGIAVELFSSSVNRVRSITFCCYSVSGLRDDRPESHSIDSTNVLRLNAIVSRILFVHTDCRRTDSFVFAYYSEKHVRIYIYIYVHKPPRASLFVRDRLYIRKDDDEGRKSQCVYSRDPLVGNIWTGHVILGAYARARARIITNVRARP